MGTVINLRNRRKRKAREEREAKAEENRVLFGLNKTEKTQTAKLRDQDTKRLDGKKLNTTPDAPDGDGPMTDTD